MSLGTTGFLFYIAAAGNTQLPTKNCRQNLDLSLSTRKVVLEHYHPWNWAAAIWTAASSSGMIWGDRVHPLTQSLLLGALHVYRSLSDHDPEIPG